MTEHSTQHATFAIERDYDASPARVFRAFAELDAKKQWFTGPPEWGPDEHAMDFRIGGRETSSGGPADGPVHRFEAVYWDIVADQRIVYTYEMYLDDARISVSLATIELKAKGKATAFKLTEQAVHLDGHDNPEQREEGMRGILDQLADTLKRTA